jgi:ADP-ribose pyrophosphatase YjhB (NUDIX family)
MHSMAMSASRRDQRTSRIVAVRRNILPIPPQAARVRVSQLRKMREFEQVAAVCYRVRCGAIEFLLVQTRGSGRWTFPKGCAEPGLTHAQAAAIEAFEEAGVHGRIEEVSFARYACRKVDPRRSGAKAASVSAHLCQVLRLGKPKESNRNRTWFSTLDAKQRLREGRKREEGAEFVRVVDKAADRIQQLLQDNSLRPSRPHDPLRNEWTRVQFEALPQSHRWTENLPTSRILRGFAPIQRIALLTEDVAEMSQAEVLPFRRLVAPSSGRP